MALADSLRPAVLCGAGCVQTSSRLTSRKPVLASAGVPRHRGGCVDYDEFVIYKQAVGGRVFQGCGEASVKGLFCFFFFRHHVFCKRTGFARLERPDQSAFLFVGVGSLGLKYVAFCCRGPSRSPTKSCRKLRFRLLLSLIPCRIPEMGIPEMGIPLWYHKSDLPQP